MEKSSPSIYRDVHGLIDAKIRASDKDLPVLKCLLVYSYVLKYD